jgi:hypothetical protein
MDGVLFLLAIIGVLAVLRILASTGFRLLGRGVEVFLTGEVEATHARRGDITALREAEIAQTRARRGRLVAGAKFATAVTLLIAPLFTPWTRELYAVFSPLWFLSRRRRA